MAKLFTKESFYSSRKGIRPEIPAEYKEVSLYTGKYVSPLGYPVSVKPRVAGAGKLTESFILALLRYRQIELGCDKDGYGTNNRYIICEYTNTMEYLSPTIGLGETTCVVYDTESGKISASVGGKTFNGAKHPLDAIVLAVLIHMKRESVEFEAKLDKFIQLDTSTPEALDCARSIAIWLCDYLYEADATDRLKMCAISEIKNIGKFAYNNENFKPTEIKGVFSKFEFGNASTRTTKSKAAVNAVDLNGKYDITEGRLESWQEALVPVLDEKYAVTGYETDICEDLKFRIDRLGLAATDKNILLLGEAGVGKSHMALAIAAMLHLPLYRMSANALTEPMDIAGQVVPIPQEEGEQELLIQKTTETLSLQREYQRAVEERDMFCDEKSVNAWHEAATIDPRETYFQMTNKVKKDASFSDCLVEFHKRMAKLQDAVNLSYMAYKASETETGAVIKESGQQRFEFAASPFVECMKYGGVWCYDEVTLIQNPGVLPMLNSAMDGAQSITLPTGEIVKRNPLSVFIFTGNLDYEGCRNLNQAFVDRCNIITEIKAPEDDVFVERIKKMTNFDDAVDGQIIDIDKMVLAYKSINELAKKLRMDGVLGPRHFKDWILTSLRCGGDVLEAANKTIIYGLSTDPRDIEEMQQKIIEIFNL